MPDHPTPISCRTHTSNPVPYMLYDSSNQLDKKWNYNETEAGYSGNVVRQGHEIINKLFEL